MVVDKLGHGMTRFGTLVSTYWLREQISAISSGFKLPIRILDCSATPDPAVNGYKEFYQQSHIPSAAYFSLHSLCPAKPPLHHKYPVPDNNRFQDYAESLGIDNDTHIISYDRSNTSFALKTWWLFRLFGHKKISVLDGGFIKWLNDGFEVTVEEPRIVRTSFRSNYNPELIREFTDMLTNLKTMKEEVIDASNPIAFHNQKDKLPSGAVGGHIPGAVNIPYNKLFVEDGTFKAPEKLKKIFDEANVDLSKPLVASCQTAMTACGLAAAAHIMGKETVPVYNGSFQEWVKRAAPDQISDY